MAVVGAGRVGLEAGAAAGARRGEAHRVRHRRVQAGAGEVARREVGRLRAPRCSAEVDIAGAVRAGRRDRPGRRPSACAARWCAARPTTSSPTTAWPRTSRRTASCSRPTSSPARGGLINISVELEGYDAGPGPAPGGRHRGDDGGGARPGRGRRDHPAGGGVCDRSRAARRRYRGRMTVSPWPRDRGQSRRDRGRHADGGAHPRRARLRRGAGRQARGLQPGRQREGPDRRGDDRRRRGRGPHRARAAPPSSRPPRATPASRWPSCAPPAATSSCWRCPRA